MPDFSLVPRWQRGFLRFMVLCGLLLSLGAGAAPRMDAEEEAWNAARSSSNAEAVQIYLNQYPKGRYAGQARLQVAKLKAEASRPAVGRSFRDCNDKSCPEMVVIPSGSFMMGSEEYDNEKPVHRVTISYGLAVGKYEVTFEEWDACVKAKGCSHKPDDAGWGRGRRPVMRVSWDDTQAYVRWLSGKTGKQYRLLSESEWEYAARAGTTTRYSFGDDKSLLDQYAWYGYEESGKQTHPVGEKRPNAFGLHDMHGNVYEWVQDCYQNSYNGASTNGGAVESNNCARRVLRGGAWDDIPRVLRSANRLYYTPVDRDVIIGFRVARTLP